MLYWAVVFFVLALIAGFLGFGAPHTSSVIAQILFFVFMIMFLIALVAGLLRRPPGDYPY